MEVAKPKKKIRTHSKKKKDIISRLPEAILHHILCFLSQKTAIKTCVLSKAWRYLGSTRPKIELTDDTDFDSPATLDTILQSYHDRNLCLDEFSVRLSPFSEGNVSPLLRKWIPTIVHNMRVQTLRLIMSLKLFQLPSLIFISDHIKNLSLQACVFQSESPVYFPRLQTLMLDKVDIPEEILNSILSNCPFLEDASLEYCNGFKSIKLFINNNNNNSNKLARFRFSGNHFPRDVSIEIGDDLQTLTTVDTSGFARRGDLSLARVHLLSYSLSCNFTTLYLYDVYVPERILDNILSYCPSVKNVSLLYCKGFETIEMLNNRPTNLEHFCFHGVDDRPVSIEIGNEVKTLRSIDINHCLFSVSRNKPLECARLTRLILSNVKLLSKTFSCNLHSLEELELDRCKGIKKFKLSSRSMKRLSIDNVKTPFKATIDAPSMVSFVYEGILPESISFTTTPDEWKSNINLGTYVQSPHLFDELYGLLEALSQSEISLELDPIEILRFGSQLHIGDNSDSSTNDDDDDHIVGVSEEASKYELPVAVEHLRINRLSRKARSNATPFLNMLFRMFRPSFVYLIDSNKKHCEIAELLFKEREPAQCYFWQSVLEGVSLQVKYHRKQRVWQPVEHTSFAQVSKKCRELKYRIHLTWRD